MAFDYLNSDEVPYRIELPVAPLQLRNKNPSSGLLSLSLRHLLSNAIIRSQSGRLVRMSAFAAGRVAKAKRVKRRVPNA